MTPGGVAAAVARAHGFVDAHGDPLQRARAAALRDAGALATVDGLLPPVDTPVGAFVALTWLDALRVRRGRASSARSRRSPPSRATTARGSSAPSATSPP